MIRSIVLAGWLVVVMACPVLVSAAMPASETVLPDTTKAWLSIPDFDKLASAFERTPLGRLLDDPDMQDFRNDLENQVEGKDVKVDERLGIPLEDLQGLPSGEVALALIQPPTGKGVSAALIDVTGNLQAAGQTLQKIDASLTKNGAKRVMHPSKFAKAPLTVYTIPPKGKRKLPVTAIYVIEANVLCVFDDLPTAEDILSRLATPKKDNLASVPGYKSVFDRCMKPGPFSAHLRWWAEPVAAGEAAQSMTAQRAKRDYVKIAKKEGYDAIKGIGGMVNLATKPYGVMHRTSIIAPPPYQRSMQMLKFPNAAAFTPEPWVPSNVDTYITFQWDLLNAFDNFGTLFDEIVGEGEPNVWNDVIESMKTDPNGPKLDLRNELIANLDQRCSVLIDTQHPITVHSQRRLFAAKTKDEAKVAAAVDKAMQNDQGVKTRVFKPGDVEYKIYELIPEDEAVPGLDIQGGVKDHGSKDEAASGENVINLPAGPGDAVVPHSAVTVAEGYLFIASHVNMLEELLKNVKPEKPLAGDKDYAEIIKHLTDTFHLKEHSMQTFVRDDERFEVLYELFRQGKLPEADMPIAQALNAIIGESADGAIRKPKLDGKLLPDFSVVQKYLSTGGTYVTSEPDGWFVTGFTLDNK